MTLTLAEQICDHVSSLNDGPRAQDVVARLVAGEADVLASVAEALGVTPREIELAAQHIGRCEWGVCEHPGATLVGDDEVYCTSCAAVRRAELSE